MYEDKQLTSMISDSIMNLETLNDHCREVALKESGAQDSDFENENTPAYKLYWSIYNTEMTRLTMLAAASWYKPQGE